MRSVYPCTRLLKVARGGVGWGVGVEQACVCWVKVYAFDEWMCHSSGAV